MNLGPIAYTDTASPTAYACTTCRKSGVKLWREYQTCADFTVLECCDCAGKSQGKDVSEIDGQGKLPSGTDTIGWRVPAVPTEDGTTFWGYCAGPTAGRDWWRRLATRMGVPA